MGEGFKEVRLGRWKVRHAASHRVYVFKEITAVIHRSWVRATVAAFTFFSLCPLMQRDCSSLTLSLKEEGGAYIGSSANCKCLGKWF